MPKMEFLYPLEAKKFKNKSVYSFGRHSQIFEVVHQDTLTSSLKFTKHMNFWCGDICTKINVCFTINSKNIFVKMRNTSPPVPQCVINKTFWKPYISKC